MRDKILAVLYFVWSVAIPILLAIGLGVGIFFNLYQVQLLPFWLAMVLTFLGTSGFVVGITKLLKIW